ncbi:MAG: TetR/AcrR family transcriptional regulator [Lachnospirales bacterium]
MEKFLALELEKQYSIMESAMNVFARYGYRKASINDIAKKAKISKSMVFYYFSSKKELYLFLVNIVFCEIMGKINEDKSMDENDIFVRIISATDNKFEVLRKYPSSISFLSSFYSERDEQVVEEVMEVISLSYSARDTYLNTPINKSKFKDSVDFDLVQKIVTKVAEGYSVTFTSGDGMDLDDLQEEFHGIMDMLKQNFYKEEYL